MLYPQPGSLTPGVRVIPPMVDRPTLEAPAARERVQCGSGYGIVEMKWGNANISVRPKPLGRLQGDEST
jgi:hypothetical protein